MERKEIAALLLKEDSRGKGDDRGPLGKVMIQIRNAVFPSELS